MFELEKSEVHIARKQAWGFLGKSEANEKLYLQVLSVIRLLKKSYVCITLILKIHLQSVSAKTLIISTKVLEAGIDILRLTLGGEDFYYVCLSFS